MLTRQKVSGLAAERASPFAGPTGEQRPDHGPSPELYRLLNAAALDPGLCSALLAAPALVADWVAQGAGAMLGCSLQDPTLTFPPMRLTSNDRRLLEHLAGATTLGEAWRLLTAPPAGEALLQEQRTCQRSLPDPLVPHSTLAKQAAVDGERDRTVTPEELVHVGV